MHFSRPSSDEPLLAELLAQGVVTQSLWNSLPMPDEGNLVDVLIEHGERFDDEKWAYWLVKQHGCLRMAGLEPDPDFYGALSWPAKIETHSRFFGCFPCHLRDGIAGLACVRPDLGAVLEEILTWLGASRRYLFALTPRELKFWTRMKRPAI
ncbi:MAG TPA: hypothetical protein VNW30_10370 [Opitutaceae bacterium]|jgi:hypothetical protein|nr:hypothetical protein [Opitutaceae bacterium]